VPLLLLTATLPPAKENEIKMFFGNNLQIIRKSTERLNISYKVVNTNNSSDLDQNIIKHLSNLINNITNNHHERVIVFCQITSEVEELSTKLNMVYPDISTYFHGKLSENNKLIIQNDWISGKYKIIIATKAFGMGIDYPYISLIIHKGPSTSIIDYAQESGRAGRNGSPAECIIITSGAYNSKLLQMFKDNNSHNIKECIEFIDTKLCRRAYLGSYLDGKGYDCKLYPKSKLCDNCSTEQTELYTIPLVSSNIINTALIQSNNENAFKNCIQEMIMILENS
jgi:superfamily II DNA helicase RecQ